MYLGNLNTDNF